MDPEPSNRRFSECFGVFVCCGFHLLICTPNSFSMEENTEIGDLQGFNDVYYQESRLNGTLVYTGKKMKPEPYAKDGYPGKSSTSYEYITYDEPFSARTIIFKVPMSYLRRTK
ncbi:uncharacterized protein NEMAJ01_2246 [Nematocida major]|uniref:uncharacterized protein n=1 Tax=Nematocida major TaxID=1912982 RepID=UPI00200854A5|nr:uncharacterized protein NEMAJ01_2246 [Nematocida major]KAH9387350.1 hypothetical protein NEMAJ01_2246 [Nematocida major]